jgi:hypothetical protein
MDLRQGPSATARPETLRTRETSGPWQITSFICQPGGTVVRRLDGTELAADPTREGY